MAKSNYNVVFTDYLSVTYHPDDNPFQTVSELLCSCGYKVESSADRSITKFRFPDLPLRGYAAISVNKRYSKFEFRGKCLAYLRELKQFHYLIHLLSEFNHRVTRLDATMDVSRDFPLVYRSITRKYPDSKVRLGRKTKTFNRMLEPRVSDGALTGSLYIGERRHNVSALIYDKTHEMFKKHGVEIPTTTRYELQFKAQHCVTLKDADKPLSLFWHYGSDLLLKRPEGVPEWRPNSDYYSWSTEKQSRTAYEALLDSLAYSSDVEQWLILLDACGPNVQSLFVRALLKRLGVDDNKSNPVNR